jgi:hypothetical protein
VENRAIRNKGELVTDRPDEAFDASLTTAAPTTATTLAVEGLSLHDEDFGAVLDEDSRWPSSPGRPGSWP